MKKILIKIIFFFQNKIYRLQDKNHKLQDGFDTIQAEMCGKYTENQSLKKQFKAKDKTITSLQ
ncbi:MAG: hypothetical protein OXC46_02805 [Thaumarchaeota archaeon]|nr:hypothetical protein [Nitrososphaerota archaeon]